MRELDIAIAEALGWDVTCLGDDCIEWQNGKSICRDLPHYSTDGNAMLELVEILRGKLLFTKSRLFIKTLHQYTHREYTTTHMHFLWFITPGIVALAAYKALTGKEWEV